VVATLAEAGRDDVALRATCVTLAQATPGWLEATHSEWLDVQQQLTVPPAAPVPPALAEAAPGCDPNYSGCVPIASDVDCIGGDGDGPEYVGQVQVAGTDHYGLDADNTGLTCD